MRMIGTLLITICLINRMAMCRGGDLNKDDKFIKWRTPMGWKFYLSRQEEACNWSLSVTITLPGTQMCPYVEMGMFCKPDAAGCQHSHHRPPIGCSRPPLCARRTGRFMVFLVILADMWTLQYILHAESDKIINPH
ncbi:hypothetical protein M413DRAFT_375837 [Hebeloma cylindrosporum]|uniref:Secreted protein n=1 Tax=Hebeloma cylindrosporum TaxID=76867 RepID=A0A0C2YT46_HEBCY|nr:hypothetical protein M413DRAFT_375837 [Hebeloma cylindrosporum h7]